MADPFIIECVWITGAAVLRYSFLDSGFYDEELVVSSNAVRLDRLNSGAPVLNTHKTDDVPPSSGLSFRAAPASKPGRDLPD